MTKIPYSTGYALCEHVEGRTHRVLRKGSKHKMDSARRAAKRDHPGKSFCIFLTASKQVGDLIR
jgi:hypothetical protein